VRSVRSSGVEPGSCSGVFQLISCSPDLRRVQRGAHPCWKVVWRAAHAVLMSHDPGARNRVTYSPQSGCPKDANGSQPVGGFVEAPANGHPVELPPPRGERSEAKVHLCAQLQVSESPRPLAVPDNCQVVPHQSSSPVFRVFWDQETESCPAAGGFCQLCVVTSWDCDHAGRHQVRRSTV